MIKIRQRLPLLLVAFCVVIPLTACSSSPLAGDSSYIPWHFKQRNQNAIWKSLRKDFSLSYEDDNPYVRKHIKWYQKHPKYFQHILKKSEPFINYVYQQTRQRSLPAELALIPLIESEYDPNSGSRRGPAGLWQIMPETAHNYGLKINKWYDGRRDVTASTKAALDYLSFLHKTLDKDWLMAVAAYQTGETKAKSVQIRHKNFWQSPFAKARSIYLPKLLAIAAIIKEPERYHISLPSLNSQKSVKEINLGKPMDLYKASKEVGISLDTLHRYNPGLRQNQLNPNGPYTVLVPADNSGETSTDDSVLRSKEYMGKNDADIELAKPEISSPKNTRNNSLSEDKKKKPTHRHIKDKKVYEIRSGDSLVHIAKRFHVSVQKLKQKNHINNERHLKPGQSIIIS